MCLAPRSALALGAPGPPSLLQCVRRQNHGNQSAVLHDFNAAQRRNVIKKPAEVVFRLTCRYPFHILAILAETLWDASQWPMIDRAVGFQRLNERTAHFARVAVTLIE